MESNHKKVSKKNMLPEYEAALPDWYKNYKKWTGVSVQNSRPFPGYVGEKERIRRVI